jgi:hypothetical protein
MKEECNHILGTVEEGYQGEYSNVETLFIHLQSNDLKELKKLQSNSEESFIFNFCPKCGQNLENTLNKKIKMMEKEVLKRKKEEEKQKIKKQDLFNKKVLEAGISTKLNQLPEDQSFAIIFYPTQQSYGKDVLMAGDKNFILRNCVHYNSNKSNPEQLIVKKIYIMPTKEEFDEIFTKCGGWDLKSFDLAYSKNEGNKSLEISIDSSGTVYLNTKTTDEFGDTNTNYDRFSFIFLEKFLGINIELKTFTLK